MQFEQLQQRGRDLVMAVVGEDGDLILGDSTWQSAPGIEMMLDECPARVCFIDEVGDELMKVNTQAGNVWVGSTPGLLKKVYNASNEIRAGRTKHQPGVLVFDTAMTMVCAATPQKFWGSFGGSDLESGVVNRFTILPVMEVRSGLEQIVPYEAQKPPGWLVDELRKLPRCKKIDLLDQRVGDVKWPRVEEWDHQYWESKEAEELWLATFRERTEENEKKRMIGKRCAENGVRKASIVAAGCFRREISTQDIGWGLAIAKRSVEIAHEGAKKFLHSYLYFPEMCQELQDFITASGGFVSKSELHRALGRKDRFGNGLLGRAIEQLTVEARIKWVTRKTAGRTAEGWELIDDV
jgi:hypothetical protein